MNRWIGILENDLLELAKAADVLRYSFDKCSRIDMMEGLDNEELESFEALTSRFARVSDLLIQKVFRTIDVVELEDAGTVRDRINRAAKKELISDADAFIGIRMLRNEIAHEYKSETVYVIFEKVLCMTPTLLEGIDSTIAYARNLNIESCI
ncbi:conserved hypothetical protein [Desulfamplus magnetovallimortis]|uniref:DUF86 domain-containing protein n=1 Tax=Desulfamplus magnetovallimortis TaxID=1246637 RepID=A0A1W1HE14_9BACT|nr:hypothetical protein [Desulfamplus magnetovallimortis]SLM30622.1 conserved hypothetical protein [Desulfamplus magnetovallimortis]